jgi:tight adherence protein B
MIYIVFSLLMFLAVGLAAYGVIAHRGGAAGRKLQARLRGVSSGQRDLPRVDIERDDRYSAMPWMDRLLRSLQVGQNLEMKLYQAGMRMRAGVLVMLIAALALGGYVVGLLFFHRVGPGLLLMAILAPIPYLYVLYRKGKRMKAFAKEFPDALDLLVSALRAGLSFSAAMQIVAEESPEPIRGAFAVTVEEQSLGLDFRESLVNLTKRVDSLDLRFFVTAVILQRETGGNLAEILENTARLIRDRFRVLGDVATYTAQGRLTGAILMCLPIFMALYTYAVAPEYFKPVMESEGGRVSLMIAGSMQLLGMLVIRKIVNIKA